MHLLYLGMGRFTQKIRVKQLEIYDMELLINGGNEKKNTYLYAKKYLVEGNQKAHLAGQHDNPKLGEKLFSSYYWHITFIYIESLSIFGKLSPSTNCLLGPF